MERSDQAVFCNSAALPGEWREKELTKSHFIHPTHTEIWPDLEPVFSFSLPQRRIQQVAPSEEPSLSSQVLQ